MLRNPRRKAFPLHSVATHRGGPREARTTFPRHETKDGKPARAWLTAGFYRRDHICSNGTSANIAYLAFLRLRAPKDLHRSTWSMILKRRVARELRYIASFR